MHAILVALEFGHWSFLALLYALLSIETNRETEQDYLHSRKPQTHSPVHSPGPVKSPRAQELCLLDNRPWACPAKKAPSLVSAEQQRTIHLIMLRQVQSEALLVDEEAQALVASDQTVR